MSVIEEELQEVQTQKTEHGETLTHLSGNENLPKKTLLLNSRQAHAFATLWSIAEENDITFLKNWLTNNAEWLVSVKGEGRKNIVEVSKFKGEQAMNSYNRLIEAMGGKR